MLTLLGATPYEATSQIAWILASVVALALVVAVVAWIVRRATIRSNDSDHLSGGFSLSDIRRMHREGLMSDEEFESTKRLLLAQGRSLMDDEDGGSEKNSGSDSDKMIDEDPTPPGS